MMRKILILVVVSVSLVADGLCPFCDSSVLDYQKFYEDELVVAIYTHKPVTDGHCLIIPKRHVERYEELTDEEALHVYHAIQKVDRAVTKAFGTRPYMLLQKNGVQVGQSVPHIHVHYIPRKESDTSVVGFLMQLLPRDLFSPISELEMKGAVAKLHENMD